MAEYLVKSDNSRCCKLTRIKRKQLNFQVKDKVNIRSRFINLKITTNFFFVTDSHPYARPIH